MFRSLIESAIKARKPLIFWAIAALVGFFFSGVINNLLDGISGRQVTLVTLFGQGQLLNPAAALAIVAAGRLLWQEGKAPAALRVVVGTASILAALLAVALSVDQHVAGGIAAELTNQGILLPKGSVGGWPDWITTSNLLPTSQVTATVSEWLYGFMFLMGGFCVVVSEAK
jgi:hypothetical protein